MRHERPTDHRLSPPQETRAEAVAKPSGPASPRHRVAAPGAASAIQAEAGFRTSRDPSQRARAFSAWNPTLGDSSNSVNLSAVFSMAYRALLQSCEELTPRRPPPRQANRE